MITYEGLKYACVHCIRGHRSSTCDHRDRPLLQVRRRGRPVGDGGTRLAILSKSPCKCIAEGRRCLCDHAPEKCVVVRTIDNTGATSGRVSKPTLKLRTSKRLEALKGEEDADEPFIRAGKYMFVSIGDGLYRKELAPAESEASESNSAPASCCGTQSAPASCCGIQPEPASCCSSRAESYSPETGDNVAAGMFESSIPDASLSQIPHGLQDPDAFSEYSSDRGHRSAPALIAPMFYNGHKVDDLGFTQEETAELWGAHEEIDFAAMCVMPGQCQCDEDCSCENCYTHARDRGDKTSML